MSEELSVLLRRLLDQGEVPADRFDFEEAAPQRLGLVVTDGKVLLPAGVVALDAEAISAQLSPEAAQWLRGVTVFPTVDSTNSRMVKLAQSASIDGLAWFAELQTAGRGRRAGTLGQAVGPAPIRGSAAQASVLGGWSVLCRGFAASVAGSEPNPAV